jgi:hypothetical protein
MVQNRQNMVQMVVQLLASVAVTSLDDALALRGHNLNVRRKPEPERDTLSRHTPWGNWFNILWVMSTLQVQIPTVAVRRILSVRRLPPASQLVSL